MRGGGPHDARRRLSGGNQQKVVAAREIARDPKVLIAAQPTRGLDVGAIEYLHRRLVEERDEGRAILLVSLELDEILSLSDRILVIYEGEIVGEHGADVTRGGDRARDARRRRGEDGGVSERDSSVRAGEPPEPEAAADRHASRRRLALCAARGRDRRPGAHGAARVPDRRPRRARDRATTRSSPTATSSTAPGSTGSSTRRRTPRRHAAVQPPADAAPDDDADPRRASPSRSPSAAACSTSAARASTSSGSSSRTGSASTSSA